MNTVKRLGRACVWVVLGVVLFGLVATTAGVVDSGSKAIWVAWHSNVPATDPGAWGRVIGNIVGQLVILLFVAFLWFKLLRWLRPRRPRINV